MADIYGFSPGLQELSDRAALTGELGVLGQIRNQAPSVPFIPRSPFPAPWGQAFDLGQFPGHSINPVQPWQSLQFRPNAGVVGQRPALAQPMGMTDMGNWQDPRGALAQVTPEDQPQQQPAPRPQQPNTGTQQPSMGTDPAAAAAAQAQHAQQSQDSDAWRWGLLAAGLGILANNSGHYGAAGPALGKGGMMGLQTYFGRKDQEEATALRQQQMAQTKAYQDKQLSLQDRQVGVQESKLRAEQDRIKAMAAAAKSMPSVQANPDLLAMADVAPAEVFKIALENAQPSEFEKLMKMAGIEKGSPEWSQHAQDYIRKKTTFAPPMSITNIPAQAEKAGVVELAKLDAKQVDEWAAQSTAASKALQPIVRMEQAVNNAKTYNGFLANYQKDLANILNSVGVPVDTSRLASSEEYESQMAQWVRNNIKALGSGTAISNVDLAFTQNSGPAMRNSIQGKKLMLKAMRADLEWIQRQASRVREHFYNNQGSLRGWTPDGPEIIPELQNGGQTPSGAGGTPSIGDIMRRK